MKKSSFCIALVLLCGSALADTWTDSAGLTWTYSILNSEVTVEGVSSKSGNIEIPSILGGESVTTIGAQAFTGAEQLQSITLPSSITIIKQGAFDGCSSITNLIVDNIKGASSIEPTAGHSWVQEVAAYDNSTVYRSNPISDNGSTSIEYSLENKKEVVFAWKVDSESGYDKLS